MTAFDPGRAAAGLWCDRVWQQREGWAITALGLDPYLTTEGTYAFRGFRQASFRWPSQRRDLLDVLLRQAAEADVYMAPLLRDRPSRGHTRSRPKPGRYAWMDADNWDDERHSQLLRSGVEILSVASGGTSVSRHLYVDLGELLPGEVVTDYSKRLARAFSADNYGGNAKLLRLPGTWNHKPRVAGGQAGAVRWLP